MGLRGPLKEAVFFMGERDKANEAVRATLRRRHVFPDASDDVDRH